MAVVFSLLPHVLLPLVSYTQLFYQTFISSPLNTQLFSRYRNGLKGHRKAVILGVIKQYLQVEMQFNEGS